MTFSFFFFFKIRLNDVYESYLKVSLAQLLSSCKSLRAEPPSLLRHFHPIIVLILRGDAFWSVWTSSGLRLWSYYVVKLLLLAFLDHTQVLLSNESVLRNFRRGPIIALLRLEFDKPVANSRCAAFHNSSIHSATYIKPFGLVRINRCTANVPIPLKRSELISSY